MVYWCRSNRCPYCCWYTAGVTDVGIIDDGPIAVDTGLTDVPCLGAFGRQYILPTGPKVSK